MEITEKKVTIADLTAGYEDKKENCVFGYSGRLEIRPSFQREFVYKDDKRNAVIDTVLKGFPPGVPRVCGDDPNTIGSSLMVYEKEGKELCAGTRKETEALRRNGNTWLQKGMRQSPFW